MLKTRIFYLLLIVSGTAFFSGCLATEQHIGDLQGQLNELNLSLARMQKNQAELTSKLDYLSSNLVAHSENLKDFDAQLSKISGKIDDMLVLTGRETRSIRKIVEKQEKQTQSMLPGKIYNQAYSHFVKKRYELAVKGFQIYLEKYPSAELAESAYYYLGDSYSGLKDWKKAAVAYAKVLEKYRRSQFTAAARLKYANCLMEVFGKHNTEASNYLKSVVQDFPNTPEAAFASRKLRELQKESKEPSRR